MTISPLAPSGAAPAGVPAVDGTAAPAADFLAVIQAAMSQAAPAKAVEGLAAAAPQVPDAATSLADGASTTDAEEPHPPVDQDGASATPGAAAAAAVAAVAAAALVPPAIATVVAPTAPADQDTAADPAKVAAPPTQLTSAAARTIATEPRDVPSAPTSALASTPTSADPSDAQARPDQGTPASVSIQPTTPGLETVAAQPPQPAGVTVASAASAPTDATTSQPAAPLDRVSAQVFGEVTSLASRGNGTHRITMTLNPESLGEVRVVMTVRDGSVHVRLAAGHEARTSLADGSPELARMLEHAGAGEARIVVRELPAQAVNATSGSAPGSSQTDTPGTPFQAGQGGERSSDQHARTRADHPATDGPDPSTPRPTRAPVQPVSGTRAAGVDLTM